MAQTNYTPISLYYSTTASAVPTAANLVPGELAINTNDGKLYYEDSSGVVQVLATKSTGSIGGSNTQVQFNNSGSLGGSSGLTWDGSFLTTSSIKNSALTSGRVTYAGASGLLSDSATLTYNGTTLTASTGANFATTSGFVGIGTSSPSSFSVGGSPILVVGNNAQTQITLYGGSSVGDINFATSSSGAGLYSGVVRYDGTSNFMSFWTNSTERMRIDSSGNLLVGVTVTDPITSKVSGATVTPSTTCFRVYSDVSNACAIGVTSTGSALVSWYYNGANFVGSVTTNGTGVTYGTASDYRLKENISPMTGALAKVAQLKPVTYKWKSNGSDGQGFIAHELAEVVPDCVNGEKDAVDKDGKPVYQGVDTSFLIATLTKAIQEQQALIESLTTRLTALENK